MDRKKLVLSEGVLKLFKEKDPLKYGQEIQDIYRRNLSDINTYTNLSFINSQCGKIYEEISNLNISYGLWDKSEGYDHYLLYVIAGWVIDHHGDNINIKKVSQEEFADSITKQIMNWVKEQNK